MYQEAQTIYSRPGLVLGAVTVTFVGRVFRARSVATPELPAELFGSHTLKRFELFASSAYMLGHRMELPGNAMIYPRSRVCWPASCD
jgi:hypothetical protein